MLQKQPSPAVVVGCQDSNDFLNSQNKKFGVATVKNSLIVIN